MSTEQGSIERTRSIVDDIMGDLERHLGMYKSHVVFLKGRIRRDKQEAEILLQTAASTLSDMKERNERLVDERNLLKTKIEQDVEDLQASEGERHELLGQIRELETHNSNLKEVLREKNAMLGGLVRKAGLVAERNRQKEAGVDVRAELFRTWLGMDILPLRENVIKVVFDRVCADESVECFVTMDLASESPVTDVFPRIHDVERLNFLFREHGNFHGFLRALRGEFCRECSRMQ